MKRSAGAPGPGWHTLTNPGCDFLSPPLAAFHGRHQVLHRGIFGSILSPRAPKRPPRWLKRPPRWVQRPPRWPKRLPRWPNRPPRRLQMGSGRQKILENYGCSMIFTSRLGDAMGSSKEPKVAPRQPKMTPRRPQDGRTQPQQGPNTAQSVLPGSSSGPHKGPKGHPKSPKEAREETPTGDPVAVPNEFGSNIPLGPLRDPSGTSPGPLWDLSGIPLGPPGLLCGTPLGPPGPKAVQVLRILSGQ